MSTRAKMKCVSIEGENVKFECLYDSKDTPEDNSFSKWTPSGNASFNVTNPDAFKEYEVGAYYYFDIIKIESKSDAGPGSNPPPPPPPPPAP